MRGTIPPTTKKKGGGGMEKWKDIYYFDYIKNEWVDYRDSYQISSYGEVRSLNYKNTGKTKILKQKKNRFGYLEVSLWRNGKGRSFRVNRLVAFMFIENNNPSVKTQVNHINEKRDDNRIENLEWCTQKYNCNYGTHAEKTSKKVICLNTNEVFKSTMDVERATGIKNQSISDCCLGKVKSAGKDKNGNKLVWRYLEDFIKDDSYE